MFSYIIVNVWFEYWNIKKYMYLCQNSNLLWQTFYKVDLVHWVILPFTRRAQLILDTYEIISTMLHWDSAIIKLGCNQGLRIVVLLVCFFFHLIPLKFECNLSELIIKRFNGWFFERTISLFDHTYTLESKTRSDVHYVERSYWASKVLGCKIVMDRKIEQKSSTHDFHSYIEPRLWKFLHQPHSSLC